MEICAATTNKGRRCQNDALKDPEPDGVPRCWRHSIRPERQAIQAKAKERMSEVGRRCARHRKREKALAAEGLLVIPKRNGARGNFPSATPVPKRGEEPPGPVVIEPESVISILQGFDLRTADGRAEYRGKIVDLLGRAMISATDARTFLQAAKDQESDKQPSRGDRKLVFRFEALNTRDDAEEMTKAREPLNGVQ